MSAKTWFQEKMATVKDSFEFRFEAELLALTEKICIRMEETGISRTKLAEKLGITPAAITKLLSGNSNFTLRKLLRVADALEMDLKMEFVERNASDYQTIFGSLAVCSFVGSGYAHHEYGEYTLVNSGTVSVVSPEHKTPITVEYKSKIAQFSQSE